jgi:hypothetical protein
LYRWKLGTAFQMGILPTVGFNVENFEYAPNCDLRLWDIGTHRVDNHEPDDGCYSEPPMYIDAHGVVFVLDATRTGAQEQEAQARALQRALEQPSNVFGAHATHSRAPGFVLLVWNKVERPLALSAQAASDHPAVALLQSTGCPHEVVRCSVMTGEGVLSAFKALVRLDRAAIRSKSSV